MHPSKRKILGVVIAGTAVLGVATGAYAWVTDSGGGTASVTLASGAPGVTATFTPACGSDAGGSGYCGDVFPGKADGKTVVTVTNTQDRPIYVSEFFAGSSPAVAVGDVNPMSGAVATTACPANSIVTLDRIAAFPATALTQVTLDPSSGVAGDNATTVIPANTSAHYTLSTRFIDLPRLDPSATTDANNQDGCLGNANNIDLKINWDYVH